MDSPPANLQPPQPVVLSQGGPSYPTPTEKVKKRGFLATFGLLLSGWLLGNLILVALLGLVGVFVAGSSGLVRVPFLTDYFFGKSVAQVAALDEDSLTSARTKVASISALKNGKSLPKLTMTEDEVNSLLIEQIQTDVTFPISVANLKLLDNQFVFTGVLTETNAPVTIRGIVNVSSLVGKVDITEAKFGKIAIPSFIASNLIDSFLSRVGLSLSGSQIPAEEITVSEGEVLLRNVVNTRE